jgi:hypothetical protein
MRVKKHIDTDNLSDKTCRAILLEAERFNHDLTLQFGILSYHCTTEQEYISKSKELIEEMFEYHEADVDDIFYGNPPSKKDFHAALTRIKAKIEELK